MCGGLDTQTLLDGKKIELYALTGGGATKKNFPIFPNSQMLALSLALALVPHMSHLM